MYFPQFLVGMSATTIGVAIWAYLATGSIWATLGWFVLTLVILQAGYFGLVVRLLFRRSSKPSDARSATDSTSMVDMVLEDMNLIDRGLQPLHSKPAERETASRMRSKPMDKN
ncbi:hypothetical protein HB778_03955 [Mesorhizobium huakuii]|uniref:Exopolysaccharide production repressor exox n=1 Tax=Mesorhizobium huakuii TaxID=28104 RepID=A0A7G6SN17_9HYPH|nr:hypothetical protein HB778_03955 [Mesorhizobium huakuii]